LATVSEKHRAAFLGRKHTTIQNVLAVVEFDLRFTYVLAGWEESAYDARILTDALQRPDGLRFLKVLKLYTKLNCAQTYQ
jgi:hypothetical protein